MATETATVKKAKKPYTKKEELLKECQPVRFIEVSSKLSYKTVCKVLGIEGKTVVDIREWTDDTRNPIKPYKGPTLRGFRLYSAAEVRALRDACNDVLAEYFLLDSDDINP